MGRQYRLQSITAAIFVVLFSGGLYIATKTPLWTDEVTSQTKSISGQSYRSLLLGIGKREGNNSPLFYFIQKLWQDGADYNDPNVWIDSSPFSNGFLRVWPVASIAASVAVLFHYFAAHWNIWLGFYSVLVSLSSYIVWEYATQARPYALWFFLTTIQILLLFSVIRTPGPNREALLRRLSITHWLLAFTIVLSVVQNFASCLVLWVFAERRPKWHTVLFVGPAATAIYYYSLAPRFEIYFVDGAYALLGANLPIDRVAIIIFGSILWAASRPKVASKKVEATNHDYQIQSIAGFILLAAIYAGCLAIIIKFWLDAVPGVGTSFVSNRYFIVLAPIGIVMTTIASFSIIVLPHRFYKVIGLLVLASLMLLRFSRTWDLVILRRISGN